MFWTMIEALTELSSWHALFYWYS